jgi:hypothetical protein
LLSSSFNLILDFRSEINDGVSEGFLLQSDSICYIFHLLLDDSLVVCLLVSKFLQKRRSGFLINLSSFNVCDVVDSEDDFLHFALEFFTKFIDLFLSFESDFLNFDNSSIFLFLELFC